MKKLMVIALALLLSMAGCLESDSETKKAEVGEIVLVQEGWDNHSYQYWNAAPMSVGNISMMSLENHTIGCDVNITLELSAYFHEPLLWEQGYVNYTLTYDNETIFTTVLNYSMEVYQINLTNVSGGNITVEIQSNGSDDITSPEPGDFFIALAEFEVYDECYDCEEES